VLNISNYSKFSGGYDRGECVDSVEVFDVSTNAWSELPKLNTARGRFDATQIEDCLYACGGSNGASELNSAECFDSAMNKWVALPDMSVKRSYAGVVALNGKVYVVGGWNGSSLSSCEVYDPSTGTWSSTAPLQSGKMTQ
jgi:influenza virus NS1A-binding protein